MKQDYSGLKTFEIIEKEINKLVQERSSCDIIKPNMTLIISLEGSDGIVLASDSRESMQDGFYNDGSDRKLTKISDNIGLATSGDASLAITLTQELQNKVDGDPTLQNSVTQTAEAFRIILMTKYINWFSTVIANSPVRPDLMFIITGFDVHPDHKEKKTYVMHSLVNFAPLIQANGYAFGGQNPNYARGLVRRFYSSTRTVDELAKLAAYSITETSKMSIYVGGQIRIMKIKEIGIEILSDADINAIVRENKKRERQIQEHFFTDDN